MVYLFDTLLSTVKLLVKLSQDKKSTLEKSGVKFTKENIVFITKDGTGQTVWLETGSQSTGMQHIISRHADDFQTKHGVAKNRDCKSS